MTTNLSELKQRVSLVDYVESQGYSLSALRGSGHKAYRGVLGACPACGHKGHLFIYLSE